jgi:hypothetical protein
MTCMYLIPYVLIYFNMQYIFKYKSPYLSQLRTLCRYRASLRNVVLY